MFYKVIYSVWSMLTERAAMGGQEEAGTVCVDVDTCLAVRDCVQSLADCPLLHRPRCSFTLFENSALCPVVSLSVVLQES